MESFGLANGQDCSHEGRRQFTLFMMGCEESFGLSNGQVCSHVGRNQVTLSVLGCEKKLCSFKMGKVARMKEGGSSEAHLYALFMLEARMKVQALVKDIEFRHY